MFIRLVTNPPAIENVLNVEEVTDVVDEAAFWGSAHSGDTDHHQAVRIFRLKSYNEMS
jgi:hypothetical protein